MFLVGFEWVLGGFLGGFIGKLPGMRWCPRFEIIQNQLLCAICAKAGASKAAQSQILFISPFSPFLRVPALAPFPCASPVSCRKTQSLIRRQVRQRRIIFLKISGALLKSLRKALATLALVAMGLQGKNNQKLEAFLFAVCP